MVDFEKDIESCLTVLRNGGIILYPTDTIWGIGCDATNSAAVERIYRLKSRPDHKAMIVLVAEERDILQYVAAPDMELFDYLEKTEKPTTVIYENAIGLADNLLGSDGSAAIRICRDEFCRNLIKRLRKPIVSTSANISGEPSPEYFTAIKDFIRDGVDYVPQYRREDDKPVQPSSIIRWKNGTIEIIRS
jgi:L-threonylcarbamoyladenylate synthase